jgi:hypothetical protein
MGEPSSLRNVVEFSEGLSTKVVGFKVEAGFVAGMSSASETIIAERSLCRQWATFSHQDPQPGRGAQRVDERIVGLIRANVDSDEERRWLFLRRTRETKTCKATGNQRRVTFGRGGRGEYIQGHTGKWVSMARQGAGGLHPQELPCPRPETVKLTQVMFHKCVMLAHKGLVSPHRSWR